MQITLVDRTNHHLFRPLLYQVAARILPPGLIAPALRQVVRGQPQGCHDTAGGEILAGYGSTLPGSHRGHKGGPHRLYRAGMTSHQLDLRDRLV